MNVRWGATYSQSTWSLTDVAGRVLQQGAVYGELVTVLFVEDLSAGIHLLEVVTGNERITLKVVKL